MASKLITGFRLLFGLMLLAWVGMGLTGWQPPPVAPEAEALLFVANLGMLWLHRGAFGELLKARASRTP